MVKGRTYKHPDTQRYLKPEEVEVQSDGTALLRHDGRPTLMFVEKMSKSKYNGVDPTDMVHTHGADVTRLAVLFKAPPDLALEWDPLAVLGQSRWLDRLHSSTQQVCEGIAGLAGVASNSGSSGGSSSGSSGGGGCGSSGGQDKARAEKEAAAVRRAVHLAIKNVTHNVECTRSFNGQRLPARHFHRPH